MKRLKIFLLLFLLTTSLVSLALKKNFANNKVLAQSNEEKLQELLNQISEYESQIEKLKFQADTLSNQIAQYDAQIRLTTLKIEQTQEKIELLGGRIDELEISLQSLTNAFSNRANETYKMARLGEPIYLLISASDLNSAVSSFHYLKKIQESDRDLLVKLQSAQTSYKEEKSEQEVLQDELEEQNNILNSQKAAKANLLQITRNDEKRYQQLLSAARAEFEAIQAIIAGQGEETEVGKVSQGEKIASIIDGPSCNSSGSHVHFIVRQGSSTNSPFSYLKGGVDFENCSGSSCGSGDGDPFNPSGGWDWPINPRIRFTQGYGSTWAVRNTWVGRIYSFHNGIDIDSESSSEVKAVSGGTLYRGSYSGSSGCHLRYVRVDHDDSDLDTLYLHINY